MTDPSTYRPDVPGTSSGTLADAVARAVRGPGGVRWPGGTYRYAELARLATRIADELRDRGATEQSVVALRLPPGPLLVASILATVSLPACYLYLDPDWPRRHQLDLLDRARARFVVDAAPGTADPGDATTPVLVSGHDPGAPPHPPLTDATADPGARVACLVSTSGTTGGPRLVGLTHAGILHLVRDGDPVRLRAADRLLALAHPGFGAAIWEIWAAIDAGAELVVPASRRQSTGELAETIRSSGSTVVHLSAGLFRQFAAAHLDALDGVRLLMTGGDTVPPEQFRAARDAMTGELVACYGCTENTVFTTLYRADAAAVPHRPVPLGQPLRGTGVHVLTPDGRPVRPGETGEIHVTGAGLSAGYLGDPETTAARFRPLDLPDGPVRAYRTGDFAQRRDDGSYALTGRRDRQVQVRGFRVELADVESRLRRLESVDDAHAVQSRRPDGDSELAVVLTPANGPVDPARVLAAARDELPDFMVPDRVLVVDALPLTERGKVDRRRVDELLAAATVPVAPGAATVPVAPGAATVPVAPGAATAPAAPGAATAPVPGNPANGGDPVTDAIRRIWREVLRLEDVPDGVDFIELGGHSLRATQVVSRILAEFGVQIPLRRFYEDPTVRGLAGHVHDALRRTAEARVSGGTGPGRTGA